MEKVSAPGKLLNQGAIVRVTVHSCQSPVIHPIERGEQRQGFRVHRFRTSSTRRDARGRKILGFQLARGVTGGFSRLQEAQVWAHPGIGMRLRIATRRSPLALWQAHHVEALLLGARPELRIELVPMTTQGDRLLDASLAEFGGKGLFVKELEAALLDGRADIAVHSMKDVPVLLPAGLCLSAYLAAEDPSDALVSTGAATFDSLMPGAVIGTSSLRRQAQVKFLRSDLEVREVRGNVGTRLARLDRGDFDAVLLASAGLMRLGSADRISERFSVERFVPALAQGIIGIECREDDIETRELLSCVHDGLSSLRIQAERALSATLGGACQLPIGGHAVIKDGRIRLTGMVAAPDGSKLVKEVIEAAGSDAVAAGEALARQLLASGARPILEALGIGI